jgi:hypothetical protein
MSSFTSIPIYRWKATKSGRVRPVLSSAEKNMYLIYSEVGHYIAAIHADCLESLLEPLEPLEERSDASPL